MTEARTERIARFVYLDAFVPEDGRSAFDTRPDLEAALRRRAVDGLIPPLDPWFRRRRSACERDDDDAAEGRGPGLPQLETGHMAMTTAPTAVAGVLLEPALTT